MWEECRPGLNVATPLIEKLHAFGRPNEMGSDSCLWRSLNRSIIHQLWVEEDKRKGHSLNWAPSHTFQPLAGKGAVDDVANRQIYSYAGAARRLSVSFEGLEGFGKIDILKSMTLSGGWWWKNKWDAVLKRLIELYINWEKLSSWKLRCADLAYGITWCD